LIASHASINAEDPAGDGKRVAIASPGKRDEPSLKVGTPWKDAIAILRANRVQCTPYYTNETVVGGGDLQRYVVDSKRSPDALYILAMRTRNDAEMLIYELAWCKDWVTLLHARGGAERVNARESLLRIYPDKVLVSDLLRFQLRGEGPPPNLYHRPRDRSAR
jgi:hypothetical protein